MVVIAGSGDTGAVDPATIYSYLLSQGVSDASAAGILVNIKFESGFDPNALGDSGTSFGLFQHHLVRWDNLKAYAVTRQASWKNWQIQVDFALFEAQQMGINLQATNAVAASKEWTIKFERPANAEVKAEQRAAEVHNFTGLPAGTGDASPQVGNETLNLPSGGTWFRVGNDFFIAYRFWGVPEAVATTAEGTAGSSQVVYYKATMEPPAGVTINSEAAWNKFHPNWVDGGTTDAFRGVLPNKSYQDLVDDLLLELGLTGTDALKDVGVMAIIAIAMTREMSEAELTNRLRQTEWWDSRTDLQREWNDLSTAEQNLRVVDEALKMVGLWFTYVGQDLNVAQYDKDGDGIVDAEEILKGNHDLYVWALRIASGEVSQVQAVNVWIKSVALEDENSPWARTIRDEEIAKGQHSVNVSNMTGTIQDLYDDWGVPITEARALQLAEQVILNKLSFEDVEDELSTQAQGMYPHKPPNMSTGEWAQPYMQMYMQTLEVPEVDLFNADIAGALADGQNLAEFKQSLRDNDLWLETDNAKTEMNTKISSLGRVMGF